MFQLQRLIMGRQQGAQGVSQHMDLGIPQQFQCFGVGTEQSARAIDAQDTVVHGVHCFFKQTVLQLDLLVFVDE